MRPPEACVLQVKTPCGVIPKMLPDHSHGPFLDCAQLVEWSLPISIQTAEVFNHFQKTTKDTSFLPATDQLIQTLTYFILSKKKKISSYLYCARLTETCHCTVTVALLMVWFASIILIIYTFALDKKRLLND